MRVKGNIPGGGLAEVEIEGDRIRSVRSLGPADPAEPFLSPGFVDIQINGFEGTDFSSPDLTPEQAISILPTLWRTGVTTFCPTLLTNTHERLLANLHVLEKARQMDTRFARAVPCYHLEGPYLSPGPSHGTHNPAHMRAPDWEEFSTLQAAAGNRIGIVTLAPELPGALDFIRRAREAGILVGLSHTDGSPEDVHRAAEAGATLATHLGNGCPDFIHRHRAPLWAQLADDRLNASLICDGFHLPPEIIQVVARVKGIDRTVLITDAVHVAGLPPGRHTLVGVPIELEASGRVVRVGSSSMAGSSLSMNRAVIVFKEATGVSLADAVRAATRNPAELLRHEGVCVEISPGQPANLILFRPGTASLEIESIWLCGENVGQEIKLRAK